MSSRRFVAAALQMCSRSDIDANLSICERRAAEAADAGARILVLPENFAFLGENERDKMAVAERLDAAAPGPIVRHLATVAKRLGLWIIAGGMAEIPSDAEPTSAGALERTHNACLAISPNGEVAAVYRKIHLFDVDIPGRATIRESDTTRAGNALVSVETSFARIGLSVCYDLRFPELYRDLALKHAAHVLVVPAAFTAYTGAAHWHTLLRARAIENQCYVIAAAQYGRHNARRESYGHSLIVDPWGAMVAELADGEGLVMHEIDLDHLDGTRQRMPCHQHQVLLR